jgi:hypothetical protein
MSEFEMLSPEENSRPTEKSGEAKKKEVKKETHLSIEKLLEKSAKLIKAK